MQLAPRPGMLAALRMAIAAGGAALLVMATGSLAAHARAAPAVELARSQQVACDANATSDDDVAKTCDDFCAGRCAFVDASELPIKKQTLTVYRETPVNVTTLDEKNCGDAKGDIGFFLANHNLKYICAADPTSTHCTGKNAIEKDSQSNIFIKASVEVDGGFGPYQMCNPLYGWDTSHWQCLTYCEEPPHCDPWAEQKAQLQWMGPTCFCKNGRSNATVGRHNQGLFHHSKGGPAGYPKQCLAQGLTDITTFGYCVTNGTVLKTLPDATLAECCEACGKTAGCGGYHRPDGNTTTGPCELISAKDGDINHRTQNQKCDDGYNLNGDHTHISDGVLGGFWYSLPVQGECKEAQQVGDGGCTWKVEKVFKMVNSTCVNAHIDAAVESHGKDCFATCAEPTNQSTLCYATCFAGTVNGNKTAGTSAMSTKSLEGPFEKAFESDDLAKGGCPPASSI